MDDTRARIESLLDEEAKLWYGPQKRAAIDEAVALADELGDEDLQFAARMALTNCAVTTGDTDAELSSFAWCLAKYDQDPVRFGDSRHGDVLWHYKWACNALINSPIFSRAQIDATLDDMEAHYRKAGVGLQAVIWERFICAEQTGNLDQAEGFRSQFLATPRDDYSDCDACTRSSLADFAVTLGEEAEALRLVDEIINGDYEGRHSCSEEPERALAIVLVPMLHTGQPDEARAAHLRSYTLARTNPDLIGTVGLNMRFCAITGNEARALALAERHISWLAHDALDEAGAHSFLLSLAVALTAVTNAGHGDEVVRGADSPGMVQFFGEHDGVWHAADLADAAWAGAAAIAAKFDARNGNNFVSSEGERARVLLNEHYDVPIYSDAFLAVPPPEATEPTDAEGWRVRSRDYSVVSQPDKAVEAARTALSLSDDTNRASILGRLITSLADAGDEAAAADLLPDLIAALRADGSDDEADSEERLGMVLYGKVTDEKRAALEAEVARLGDTKGPATAFVRSCLVADLTAQSAPADQAPALRERIIGLIQQVLDDPSAPANQRRFALVEMTRYMDTDDGDTALANLAEALTLADGPAMRAAVHFVRANWYGRLGRFDEGLADADEANRLFATLRAGGASAEAAGVAGSLLLDGGHPEEALTRFRYALREFEALGEPAVPMRFQVGRALYMANHSAEAVEVFSEVLRLENESEAPPQDRADTLDWLARCQERAGQPGYAADNYANAARLYEEAEMPAAAANMLVNAANLYAWYNQAETAVDILGRALALAETEAGQPALLRVLDRLGVTKAKLGDAAGLDDLDRAEKLARAQDGAHNLAAVLDTRTEAMERLDRPAEGVAAALAAADAYTAADEPAEVPRCEFNAALFLFNQKDMAAAAPILRTALDHANAAAAQGLDVADIRKTIALKLGDAYESLGDTAAAAEVRAQAA